MRVFLGLLLCSLAFAYSFSAAQQYMAYDTSYNVQIGTSEICAGDFNNDSRVDFAAISYGGDRLVVLRNSGDGHFLNSGNYITGHSPASLFAADFDRDNDIDLAIANANEQHGQGSVSIFLNNGIGSFSCSETLLAGYHPISVSGADIDNDGDIDLAEGNYYSNDVIIYTNDGTGDFSVFDTIDFENHIMRVDFAFINGDSLYDLAVMTISSIEILLNEGNGIFANPATYYAGSIYFSDLSIVDLDNDGDRDIVVITEFDFMSIFLNNGEGVFELYDEYWERRFPRSIFSADFNRDGYADLAVSNTNSNDVIVYSNNGDLSFQTAAQFAIDSLPKGIAAADIDQDGDPDLLWTSYWTGKIHVVKNYYGDTLRTGCISGRIFDQTNSLSIDGAIITAQLSGRNNTSGLDGMYYIDSLFDGRQNFTIYHPSYIDTTLKSIDINSNDTLMLNIGLRPTGWITGIVRDTANNIIPGAKVDVVGKSISTTTDSSGGYVIRNLNNGNYNLIYSKYGFITDTANFVTIQVTDTTTQDMELVPLAPQVEVWYGHIDGSPIYARPGEITYINVYARTSADAYVANLCLCLGAMDQYIDSLYSISEGSFYWPISQWDDFSFLTPQHSPPNQFGWSAQAFFGLADLYEPWESNWLHSTDPIKILTMVIKTVNDQLFIGDTVTCLGRGVNFQLSGSSAGDTIGHGYTLLEHFSPVYFTMESPSCPYMPGDINADSTVIPADVTYGVRYFKGIGDPPPINCYLDSTGNYFYPAGDANGNCEFRGSDITRLVAYFKGLTTLSFCHWLPPNGR